VTPEPVSATVERAEHLRQQFRRTGDSAYLDRAVATYAAVVAVGGQNPAVGLLVQYANCVLARYEATGDPCDIDLAIRLARQAAQAAGDAAGPRAVALNVEANARTADYQARGNTDALFAALAAQREAVELASPGQQAHVAFSVNLANRLIFAYGVARDPAMLGEAVDRLKALFGKAMPDEWRAAALNNLGLALRARFELTGDHDDLRSSLNAQRDALRLTAEDAHERVNRLNNLANALWALYLSAGVLADLDEAVVAYKAAVAAPANSVTRAACLLGLGTACWTRWGRRQLPGDLDAAIDAFTAAAGLIDAGSHGFAHCSLNLGAAYFARWRHRNERGDLDAAIGHWQASRDHPLAEPEIVEAATSNLGAALWERHGATGDARDLDQAITLLGLAPDKARAPLQPGRIFTLAGALRRRYDLRGATEDMDRGRDAYWRACALGATGNPGVALASGQQWGEWAASRKAFAEADEAYQVAAVAASNLYRGQNSDEHTEVWLGEATTLAARHAWVQVHMDQADLAAVTLDRGRAYVLSEALRRGEQSAPDPATVTRREILAASSSQPLVYLAATPWGGVGLRVEPDGATPFILPDLTEPVLMTVAHDFVQAAEYRVRDMRRWHLQIAHTCEVLWDIAVGPLLEQMDGADSAVIVPTGWLNLLPLHAARPRGADVYALDRLCFTYAPNARLLTDARATAAAVEPRGALIVDAPHRPDLSPLPFSRIETTHAASARPVVTLLRDTDATIDHVLTGIAQHDLLHLSCHATADPVRGWSSRLELTDGPLTVEQLREHGCSALLAFLSACETAVVGLRLPDEVVAFPSVLLASGIAGIVASLWPVPQAATALLVAFFYAEIDRYRPSEALRTAQQQVRSATGSQINERLQLSAADALRDDKRPFAHPYFWAGFTYTGA
jgi:CHAT domain-containing protein